MDPVLDIRDLADLFIELNRSYGEASVSACSDYWKAFENYSENHPHLKELFPEKSYRDKQLALRVRAFARRKLLEQDSKIDRCLPGLRRQRTRSVVFLRARTPILNPPNRKRVELQPGPS